MWERFTERAKRAVFNAQEEAARLGENCVRTEHMLLALIRDRDSHAYQALERVGVTADTIWQHMGSQLRYGNGKLDDTMQLTMKSKRAIDSAFSEAVSMNSPHIGTGHLLLGIASEDGLAGRTISDLGITLEQLRDALSLVENGGQFTQPSDSNVTSENRVTQFDEKAKRLSHDIDMVLSGVENIKHQLTQESGLVSECLRGRDVLSIRDLDISDITQIFATASWLKRNGPMAPQLLQGKTLAMIFEKPSLRTRISFETGIFQLGGVGIYLQPNDIQLGKRESIADAAHNMERMVQGIMARVFAHSTVVELAKASSVPVINGLSDLEHPCQALADFLTIKEKKGSFKGLKIAYIGDGNNVTHSLMLLAAKVGANFWSATPEGYGPKDEVVNAAREDAKSTHAEIHLTNDPYAAARDADVIYTDTWISMGDEAEAEARLKIFPPYQINAKLVSAAKPDAIIMHCLPAYRGKEITDEVIDSPQSVVFDEAENRLHVQKAIMAMTM